MKKFHSEIVIRVNDLKECRHFYREVLGMGDPVLDSNFFTSFQVTDDLVLTLERTAERDLEHARSAAVWRFEVEDLEQFRREFAEAGGELRPAGGGRSYWVGADPEGNRFYVREFR